MPFQKYPAVYSALIVRHEMYNAQLDYLAEQERQGNILLIQPQEPLHIGRTEMDAAKMQRVYDLGRSTGRDWLARILEFLK